MAVPKITDAQMQYYQFKARQTFLLQKENREWQEFCQKILPQHSANVVWEGHTEKSKDIGIQTSQKSVADTKGRIPISSPFQKQQMSEMLSSIKMKLEKIDLTLSNMKSSSAVDKPAVMKTQSNILFEHIKSNASNPAEIPLESWNVVDDKRQKLIQSSLKASLQRLQSSALGRKMPPVSSIKMTNSSFFLPHDLKKQRIAARKVYLASLPSQTEVKQKVSTSVVSRKKALLSSFQSKKQSGKSESKLRKKGAAKSQTKLLDESTLVETDHLTESKDENVENAVDGILNDLIGEAALVLHSIKEKKKEKQINTISSKLQFIEDENVMISKKWAIPTSSSQALHNENKNQNLHFSYEIEDGESENIRNQDVLHRIQKDVSEFPASTHVVGDNSPVANVQISSSIQGMPYVLKKLNPDIELSVDSSTIKRIMRQKKLFWRYLESISRTKREGFDPWSICDKIAEEIINECILDVSNEVSDVPQSFVSDLYNQEFTQLS